MAGTHLERATEILTEPWGSAESAGPWWDRGRARRPELGAYPVVKRVIDVLVCLALLPIVLPVLAACVLAIRLDTPGPAFFAQRRTGQGGHRFKMYKLRTMVQNAEDLKEQCLAMNELKPPDFKIADDPRITRVGKILRKTSLDELPQIFNVLFGDMTLVGPRPTSFESSTYSAWHTARLELKSGITGLWQVLGRNDLEFDERVRLDIAYQRSQSLWVDFQVIVRTAGAVFTRRGN